MQSALPKVLHEVAGRPMLQHVIDTAHGLAAERVHVVVGHGADQVRERLAGARCEWVVQAEQLGTGHAVAQALTGLDSQATVLVLYGDVPLVQPATLQALLTARTDHHLAMLTVTLQHTTGYETIHW